MLAFINKHRWWFLAVTIAAALLRLFFIFKLPVIEGDSLVYGDLAKCLVTHHMYGVEKASGWAPTLIRMPGYPAFLAFTFLIFGADHYVGAMLFQLVFDVLTCFLVADIARRIFSERAARTAFVLAAFCPFLMNYVATPLTECLEIFFTAAAIDCAVIALDFRLFRWWALSGAAIAIAILLRPDGGLLLGAIALPVLLIAWREPARRRELIVATLLLGSVSLAPLLPWTIRNYHVFHVIQPLVNPHASDPDEFLQLGFERWCKTWAIDYSSAIDISFLVPGEPADIHDVPNLAYTSADQRAIVHSLFAQYNVILDITPEMDRQFAALADQNIRRHPIRFYLLLPAARTLDMWFRPRTEMMPLDTHFWEFKKDQHDSLCSIALGLLNLAYVAAAIAAAWLLRRRTRYLALLLTYPIVRTLFLATIGGSEDRYTLECFPFILVLAAAFVNWLETRRHPPIAAAVRAAP